MAKSIIHFLLTLACAGITISLVNLCGMVAMNLGIYNSNSLKTWHIMVLDVVTAIWVFVLIIAMGW